MENYEVDNWTYEFSVTQQIFKWETFFSASEFQYRYILVTRVQ